MTLSYDASNMLRRVLRNGDLSAVYTYDAGRRRVRSWDTVDGATDYVYSGLSVIDEVNGGVHEKHIYAGSMHLASNSSGTIEYYHVDHLGSTRLKTDASGSVIYGSNYEPYGPEYGESGSEEFRYTGKQEDPTGLYYYGARYYDPVTGRFITRDSVFGDLSDPQSLNRYSYCRNNPHKYVDPDGKDSIQFGFGFSGGFGLFNFGIGSGVHIGIAISYSHTYGGQIGWYWSTSPCVHYGGIGGSGEVEIIYSPKNMQIEDINTVSRDINVEGVFGAGLGIILSTDPEEDLSNGFPPDTDLTVTIKMGAKASVSESITASFAQKLIQVSEGISYKNASVYKYGHPIVKEPRDMWFKDEKDQIISLP